MAIPFFRKSLQWQGYDLNSAARLYSKVYHWDKEELLNQRQQIVEHHLATNTFYNSHVIDKQVPWENLPVLTKSDLQQPLQQRLSKGFTIKNVHHGKTSGSSGNPFSYAKDKFCHAMTWAAFDHAYQQHGIDLDRSLEARFYGIPINGLDHYKERLKDYLGNRVRFPVFNMNDAVLAGYVERFCKSKYDYINGYTTSIVLFAKYCERGNLVLKEICPSLKLCIVTSEMLFKDDRELLEQVMGVPIINEYGSSETGLIAIENPAGLMAINTATLFVEVVDHQNKPVVDGTVGKILITDLFNKAHPFIRYEIGDIGSIHSINGTLILDELQGRTSDIATLPNGKIIPGLTFYYVTKNAINEKSTITEFIVIQKEPLLFKIQYIAATALSAREKQNIKKSMATYADASIEVQFEKLNQLDRSNRGKLKQFLSEV